MLKTQKKLNNHNTTSNTQFLDSGGFGFGFCRSPNQKNLGFLVFGWGMSCEYSKDNQDFLVFWVCAVPVERLAEVFEIHVWSPPQDALATPLKVTSSQFTHSGPSPDCVSRLLQPGCIVRFMVNHSSCYESVCL